MLNFQILFGQLKNSSEVCSNKKSKNEIYNVPYVLHHDGNFRRAPYCIILNI